MSRRTRIVAIVTILLVGSGVVVVGGVGATDFDDRCSDEDGATIVGTLGDERYESDDVVHEGTTLELAYCDGTDRWDGEWLDATNATGFDVSEFDDGIYEIEVTGETAEVRIAEFLDIPEYEDEPDGLVVSVHTTDVTTTLESADRVVGADDEFEDLVGDYDNATERFDTSVEELNATIERIEDDEDGSLEDATGTLGTLDDRHDTMTTQERELLEYLRTETETGNVTGTFGAFEMVGDERSERANSLEGVTETYQTVLEDERDGPQSTVRLTLVGSILGGLVVGLVAGAAVPLAAARRVEEKMKLSRNVTYDRKAALLPILVGFVGVVVGVVALVVIVGWSDLLGVIR